jgi:hypothetical protein
MAERIEKLRPDRDLQCYFERPSAIAAMSEANPSGFTVSGTWRQQFDWAVVEWSRDNVIEHPAMRYLPDGNLSGLTLSYVESRENCVPLDSTWYPTVDWPYLRVWAERDGSEQLYKVRIRDYAVPADGSTAETAWAEFTLGGTVTPGDYIELAWLSEHYTIQLFGGQTLEDGATLMADAINGSSPTVSAVVNGKTVRITWKSAGANGNRIGVYANTAGAGTESWEPRWQTLHGGTSPAAWAITLDFANLIDIDNSPVPTNAVRKMRWTWAADIQPGSFQRSEFCVRLTEWTVTGAGREYKVAGPGSRRIEDDSSELSFTGSWAASRGNYSGGSITCSNSMGSSVLLQYSLPRPHMLLLGTRRHATAPSISIGVDDQPIRVEALAIPGEDVLVRLPIGQMTVGAHTVRVTHNGAIGEALYFDFFEVAIPTADIPRFVPDHVVTLATDWDTDHSLIVPPERTAWMIDALGFKGRQNHYAGALWFYELCRPGNQYASATIEFQGNPEFGKFTELSIGPTVISHANLIGDTSASIAKAFEFELNAGSTALWATADGPILQLSARAMGTAGNSNTISIETHSDTFIASPESLSLTGGTDGDWLTDLSATPRLNRAVRDWSRFFYRSLKLYSIDVVAAFSMELQHGDSSVQAGIAQRYPYGEPALLNTPALQTNFSAASTDFWKEVYLDMAQLMDEAGCTPYLQFGEVQWWYFPSNGGMPFYDAYTKARFESTYGHPMHVFEHQNESSESFPEEAAYLPALIGEFTDAIMDYVLQSYPACRFEVLYPPDVNDFALTRVINFPLGAWLPNRLDCLKTENFTFTGDRDLNRAQRSIDLPMVLGFPRSKSSHLVGIWDYTTPWQKEVRRSRAAGVESVVLFALDQFCLIGYRVPLERGARRAIMTH